jgi:hypothetical protein
MTDRATGRHLSHRTHPAEARGRAAVALALVLPALVAADALARPLPARSERVTDYRISVTLNPDTRQLVGRERIVWRNTSDERVDDLWFHLYLNAFKNTRSTFFRESGGTLRGQAMAADGWGWIDVTSARLTTGRDLMADAHFVQPDDDNVDDETVWRLMLPEPVGPGQSVALELEFTAQLPRVFARTGWAGDFFLVGQWFPKLGVYEAAGVRGREAGGWNCHQFHATSEFYADFGAYAVDITVPARFVVGATGERVSLHTRGDGWVTHRYEQADVHDFAWTASPRFVEERRVFSGTADVTPQQYAEASELLDRSLDELRLTDVEIRLLMQPEHLPQLVRHVRAARLALTRFGLRFGRYPYRTLTIVDPPEEGSGAAGMEYPTLITAGTSMLFNRWPFDRIRLPETAVVHEIGHQFWQGLVANNEFEEAWLDEGLTTYAEAGAMDEAYGRHRSLAEIGRLTIGIEESWRRQNSPWRIFDTVRLFTWDYLSEGAWAFNAYAKPGLVLRTLEGLVGSKTMARILRGYHERWRFRHPSSDDFYRVASDLAGRDLRPFFHQTIESAEVLDYEVASVETRREPLVRGFVDGPEGRQLRGGGEAAGAGRGAPDDPDGFLESTVKIVRRGDITLPVELDVKFEGQPPERYRWDGEGRWRRFDFVRPTRLEWADVDPDRRLVLDVNWANNGRRPEPDRRVAASWAGQWLFWLQNLLVLVGP